jgi:hypothetical protein
MVQHQNIKTLSVTLSPWKKVVCMLLQMLDSVKIGKTFFRKKNKEENFYKKKNWQELEIINRVLEIA